jgi:hypothetical protein
VFIGLPLLEPADEARRLSWRWNLRISPVCVSVCSQM